MSSTAFLPLVLGMAKYSPTVSGRKNNKNVRLEKTNRHHPFVKSIHFQFPIINAARRDVK